MHAYAPHFRILAHPVQLPWPGVPAVYAYIGAGIALAERMAAVRRSNGHDGQLTVRVEQGRVDVRQILRLRLRIVAREEHHRVAIVIHARVNGAVARQIRKFLSYYKARQITARAVVGTALLLQQQQRHRGIVARIAQLGARKALAQRIGRSVAAQARGEQLAAQQRGLRAQARVCALIVLLHERYHLPQVVVLVGRAALALPHVIHQLHQALDRLYRAARERHRQHDQQQQLHADHEPHGETYRIQLRKNRVLAQRCHVAPALLRLA